jgi:hypothetical protein
MVMKIKITLFLRMTMTAWLVYLIPATGFGQIQINDEAGLKAIVDNLTGSYILTAHITLTENWQPMGTFKGTLDGNGKIIYGLKYDNPEQNNVGLFADAEGAVITRLGIEQAYIVGNAGVGGIVGNAKGCTISECYVADSYIAGRDCVASIAGIMRSYSRDGSAVFTTIRNCYASGEIYSRESHAAGIVGVIHGGRLENCYFSGLVRSNSRSTGIVSYVGSDDPGEIRNNINLAAAVYGQQNRRIAEWNDRGPSGNYVVKFTNNWSAKKSYFGTDLKHSFVIQNFIKNDDRDGCNLNDDDLARTQSFYVDTLGWDFNNTWKFIAGTEGKMYPVLKWQEAPLVSKVYGIPDPARLIYYPGSDEYIDLDKMKGSNGQIFTFNITEGSQYVDRQGQYLYITETPVTEEGLAKMSLSLDPALNTILTVDPSYLTVDIEILLNSTVFTVSSPQELIDVNQKLFAKFKLVQDIDMAGFPFAGIGSSVTPFTGEFDGNGFSILNATVNSGGDRTGFFNVTDGAKIEKLGLPNLSVSGNDRLGGLIGVGMNTTIDQCFLTGTVRGRDIVGGLIGEGQFVTITNSYVDATVSSSGSHSGGLLGQTTANATITNCYFSGSIAGKYWDTGGTIGLIQASGTIKLSGVVSIGNISGDRTGYHIGAIWHEIPVPVFKNNLYNTDATNRWGNGEKWQPVEGNEVENATGKSSQQLKQQATYTAINWDFNTIWTMEEGVAYPQLKNRKQIITGIQPVFKPTIPYTVSAFDNHIYISGIGQSATVTLYNLHGQLLSEAVFGNKATLPVANKGLYIVRITENGKSTSLKVTCK